MAEVRTAADPPRRLTTIVTVASMVAVVGIAYRLDRAYARWSAGMSPLSGPRARVGDLKVRYGKRRSDLSEFAGVIFGVMDEIARARSDRSTV